MHDQLTAQSGSMMPKSSDEKIRKDGTTRRAETPRAYDPPRVTRVRVETAALAAGKRTRDAHCTRHWHDNDASCPNPD